MKKLGSTLGSLFLIFSLAGCTLSLLGTPTVMALPTLTPAPATAVPSSTVSFPTATSTLALPSLTPVVSPVSSSTAFVTVPAPSGTTIPGVPSGPYAVIGMAADDVLNIRAAPGVTGTVSGSFPASTTTIMRTGAAITVDGDLWVEVHDPLGSTGWVNAKFLTEAVAPAAFCADGRVNALLADLGNALIGLDGNVLSSLVSPAHGMDVLLWRYGTVINFDREHARWIFDSTYTHDWGTDGASGLVTIGSFSEVVLPKLQEVFASSYTLGCNDPAVASAFSTQPWPEQYAHINYYSILKPATPGVDLDFRVWLVGVEFVQGQPYVFSLIHFQWEP